MSTIHWSNFRKLIHFDDTCKSKTAVLKSFLDCGTEALFTKQFRQSGALLTKQFRQILRFLQCSKQIFKLEFNLIFFTV